MQGESASGFSFDNLPVAEATENIEKYELHLYVRVSTLRSDKDKYYGNFSQTFSGACDEPFSKYIYKAACVGWDIVGECPGNDRVVRLDYN